MRVAIVGSRGVIVENLQDYLLQTRRSSAGVRDRLIYNAACVKMEENIRKERRHHAHHKRHRQGFRPRIRSLLYHLGKQDRHLH